MLAEIGFVLLIWPGQPFDVRACRPMGRVHGYEMARYQGEPPDIKVAVDEMVAAARKRGADTVQVVKVSRLRMSLSPRWDFQYELTGKAYFCGRDAARED